jgi:hypothetical protein
LIPFLVLATSIALTTSASADVARQYVDQSDYTSAQEWFLQGDNLTSRGHNPYFFPLTGGHKSILEKMDSSGEKYRKETIVLDETEMFDVEGLGKFETAVVQDEEFVGEELVFRVHRWIAIDKTTNSVHLFGLVSWEIDDEGNAIVEDTWRTGEIQDGKRARPGLLMPGTITIGSRFLVGGPDHGSRGGIEVTETGISVIAPAGTFEKCVRLRERELVDDKKDVVDRVWCSPVGLVSDSSSGKLIASNALPSTHPGADVSSFGKYASKKQASPAPLPKISRDEAKEKALKLIPGRVTSIVIERKRGKHVYVVEIMTRDAGEKDVLVDIHTGDVVGTE